MFEFVVEDNPADLPPRAVNFFAHFVIEAIEVSIMTGFFSFDEAVINRLSIWNQILSGKKLVPFFRKGKDLLRVRLMPLDTPLLDEPLTAKTLDVALHPCTVPAISEPSQIVCGEHAELPDISERLDFGLPQGIFAVADTIGCSRAVISILRLSEFLVSVAIRSAASVVISPGLFHPTSAVTPGIAILPEKRCEIRNVISPGH